MNTRKICHTAKASPSRRNCRLDRSLIPKREMLQSLRAAQNVDEPQVGKDEDNRTREDEDEDEDEDDEDVELIDLIDLGDDITVFDEDESSAAGSDAAGPPSSEDSLSSSSSRSSSSTEHIDVVPPLDIFHYQAQWSEVGFLFYFHSLLRIVITRLQLFLATYIWCDTIHVFAHAISLGGNTLCE